MYWAPTMNTTYLAHHGIKGMKWGVRRYQNPDGTLTAAGKARYAENDAKLKRIADEYRNDQMGTDRGYVAAVENKKFFNAMIKDYNEVYKTKDVQDRLLDIQNRQRAARDSYDQWNRSGWLKKTLTKAEGAKRKQALELVGEEWSREFGNRHKTLINMGVDRINEYFDEKKRKDVMAWLASDYGYFDD